MVNHLPLVQVLIPLVNPNEVEGVLASIAVKNRQKVEAGTVLAVFETTKSTVEITAERAGYILGLELTEGQNVAAGELLCSIADDVDAVLPATQPAGKKGSTPSGSSDEGLTPGLRITRPALALAKQLQLDLATLPIGPLITEAQVRELTKEHTSAANQAFEEQMVFTSEGSNKPAVVIYGGGGQGKTLIDLVRTLGTYHLVGVIDDGLPAGSNILGVPVLGGHAVLKELYQRGIREAINAVGGIGNLTPRLQVFETLAAAGFTSPTVVHPTAFVETSAHLAGGIQVLSHAYIGSCAEVSYGCLINTGVIVSHDCMIGEYVNLSPGAILAGGVTVGARTQIGMGVTINLTVKIGEDVRIGNSGTVKRDVPDKQVVRAGAIWPVDR